MADKMNRILVVDDDPNIRELVHVLLRNDGFDVTEAINGIDALDKLGVTRYDLIILDIMMPEMDGWQLCEELRRYYDMPLLMLTAKGETSQKVRGFQLGADDYLVKPFDPPELSVRVKALLKRYQINISQSVAIGNLLLDRKKFEIIFNNEHLTIPLKEFELLFKLGGTAGRTYTREQLIEEIWGVDFDGNERTLDVHINRLRERFPEKVSKVKITTIRGLGYRLEVK